MNIVEKYLLNEFNVIQEDVVDLIEYSKKFYNAEIIYTLDNKVFPEKDFWPSGARKSQFLRIKIILNNNLELKFSCDPTSDVCELLGITENELKSNDYWGKINETGSEKNGK